MAEFQNLDNYVLEDWETSCPLCGRVLWECVSEPGESRYCGSCNEKFYIKKVKIIA